MESHDEEMTQYGGDYGKLVLLAVFRWPVRVSNSRMIWSWDDPGLAASLLSSANGRCSLRDHSSWDSNKSSDTACQRSYPVQHYMSCCCFSYSRSATDLYPQCLDGSLCAVSFVCRKLPRKATSLPDSVTDQPPQETGKTAFMSNMGFLKVLGGQKKTTRGLLPQRLKSVANTNSCPVDGQPAKRRGPKPDSKPALTRRQELNRQAQR
jgi:hypothetical protein